MIVMIETRHRMGWYGQQEEYTEGTMTQEILEQEKELAEALTKIILEPI